MRALLPVALLLAVAGCGGDGPSGTEESSNLVSSGPPPPPDPAGTEPPPQLEAMGQDEIEGSGLAGAGCDFTVGEQVLLVAVRQGDAIARVNGRVVRLFHQGAIGETGGFFASPEIRVSVGRIEDARQPAAGGTGWPARIAVSTPGSGQSSRVEGRWSCGS